MTRLQLDRLSKTYPGSAEPALNALSLDIADGELVALLGPSGCGKTTALNLIAGLIAPDAGDVSLDGQSILSLPPEKRGTVMVFQHPLLFPHMNVADNVGFGLKMRGIATSKIAPRVNEMLERVHLPNLGHRKPSELSGGQQQRVALARALIVEPRVLLLDEPLSSLDAHLRSDMRDLIRTIQREMKITTIFVTHDQEEAVVMADKIALLLDGKLQQFAPPADFYDRPQSREIARFFGGRNFVKGRVSTGNFQSDLGSLTLPNDSPSAGDTLTIRPENIRLGDGLDNTLDATLIASTYLGTQTRLLFDVNGTRLEALANPADAARNKTGDRLKINLPPESLWILPESQNTGG